MKRIVLLLLLALSIVAMQAIIDCSKPLDSYAVIPDPDPDPDAKDTIYIFDTLYITDTVITVDTIFGYDTTFIYDTIIAGDTIILIDTVVDTVMQTDTVFIIDTLAISPTYCASLSFYQKTITWMLQNQSGTYRLEFEASGNNNDPKEELTVDIDGEEYEWRPYDNPKLVLELALNDDVKVFIYSSAPHGFGHALNICLKVENQ